MNEKEILKWFDWFIVQAKNAWMSNAELPNYVTELKEVRKLLHSKLKERE
jgi:hypothetical protein